MKCDLCGVELIPSPRDGMVCHGDGECVLVVIQDIFPIEFDAINAAIRQAREQGAQKVMDAFDQTGDFKLK